MGLVKESLAKAVGLTLLVLLVGLLIGLQVDDMRTDYIEQQLEESSLRSQTFVVTENYLSESSQNYCGVVSNQIPEIADKTGQIGNDLQSMSGKSVSNERNYEALRREYYLTQLRLYNTLKAYDERCNSNTTTVFFFFDGSTDSKRQGAVLTEYRKKVDNETHIFSYNLNTEDSPVLEILQDDFQVEEGPSTVVNGEKVFRRYISLEELKKVIKNETG